MKKGKTQGKETRNGRNKEGARKIGEIEGGDCGSAGAINRKEKVNCKKNNNRKRKIAHAREIKIERLKRRERDSDRARRASVFF
jgi:hypothetical protein